MTWRGERQYTRLVLIGVISDTHGLLRPDVLPHLHGVDAVIHGGDVGDPDILTALRVVAPTHAVRGNTDRQPWARTLPGTLALEFAGRIVYVIHDLNDLDLDPRAAGISVVVSGHTHRPRQETRDGVLFLNPGSCGPRRFKLPVGLALLTVTEQDARAELITLEH